MLTRKMIRVMAMVLLASMSIPAFGDADWYVDDSFGNDSWDCNSWDYPCKTIEGAINKASNGDVIEVNEGTYEGWCDANDDWHYVVNPNGNNVVIKSKDPNDANVVAATIISPFCPQAGAPCGDGIKDTIRRSCNFADSNEDANCQLIGFTILAYLENEFGQYLGLFDDEEESAAILCTNSSSPTIDRCIFKGDPNGYMDGIDCNNSGAWIKGCTFSNSRFTSGAIHIRGGSSHVTLEACDIINNVADGKEYETLKQGIYHEGGDVNINNCTISENGHSTDTYAAIFSEVPVGTGDANVTIIDCNISGNTPRGVYCSLADGGQLTISKCTIADNNTTGGVCFDSNDASVVISDCNLTGNISGGNGGAILVQHANDLTIEDCTIVNNKALNDHYGGGIHLLFVYGRGLISKCVITDNIAGHYGGGISNYVADDLTVENCIISGNKALGASAQEGGGGVASDYGLTIKNCEITGNKSWNYGGGIELKNNGDSVIRNCTIADNCATKEGGGIYMHSGSDSVVAKNCIIWGNEAYEGGAQIAPDNNHLDISYSDGQGCIVSGTWAWDPNWNAGNNIDVDPSFVGPGSWTLDCNDTNAVWVSGDYHLEPNSACIDSGDPNGDYSGEVDIDRQPRVMIVQVDRGSDEACYITDPCEKVQWEAVGKPECWCYQRQCHGDADGKPYGKNNYWVSVPEADIFDAAQSKPMSDLVDANGEPLTACDLDPNLCDKPWANVPGICADFDHEPYGKNAYRVSAPDADIFARYNSIGDPCDPNYPDPNCFDPNCCD